MMSTKAKSPASAAAIKWTDDEWKKIAKHIHEAKGNDILSSPHLEEIKARDVFDAQMATLPAERHRKLVSIAQGFQTIRERLRSFFEEIAKTSRDDLFSTGQAGRKPVRQTRRASSETENAPPVATGNASVVDATADPAEPVDARRNDDDGAVQEQASPGADPSAPAPVKSASPADKEPAQQPVQPEKTLPESQPQGGQTQPPAPPSQSPQSVDPAVANFIEMARPFVSMVCQELARAVVQVLSEKGTDEALAALGRLGTGQAAPFGKSGAQTSRGPGVPSPVPNSAGYGSYGSAGSAAIAPMAIDREPSDEEADYGHEPQPLFDPKLPPSPNSDFKPTIGLVGASEREALDLQAQYPQLQLVSVRADAIKHTHVFQRCQRIIGMQEDIPPPTDEFLGRSLRHRYVRITGGMDRVREQLNAWLNKPGSLNAKPPRSANRDGKGAGNSFLKKRHHRRSA